MGEEWKDCILEELDRADIVVLLYSTTSRASDLIQDVEAPKAIERTMCQDQPCALIVVPLERKDWNANVELECNLKTLQTATWNAKPALKFSPQRDGWLEVGHSIGKAVELLRRRSGRHRRQKY
ncbi:MAG: hypothetical protein R3F54_20250 [Alphaproteobacteria bacterium]